MSLQVLCMVIAVDGLTNRKGEWTMRTKLIFSEHKSSVLVATLLNVPAATASQMKLDLDELKI